MRALRIFGWTLGGLVAIVLALFAGLQTAVGQRALASSIASIASTPDARLEIVGLHGSFPTDLTVERIELSDRDGPWLRIDNARIGWTFDALLQRRLQVDTLSAARIEVLRPPAPSTAKSDGGGLGTIRLPVDIDLRSVSIGELHLAQAIAGVESRWRVEGNGLAARHVPDSRLRFTLDRTDGPNGHASADVRFDRTQGQVIADIRLDEQTDKGVAATLIGRPDIDAVSLRLQIKGDAHNGKGELTLSAGDAVTASGTAGWQREGNIVRASLRITGNAPGLPDSPVAHLVRAPVTLAADGVIDQDGVTVDRATLDASAGRIVARGRYVFAEDALDATATIELDEPGTLAVFVGEASWRDLRAELATRITGLSSRPRGTITANIVADQVIAAASPVPALGKVDVTAKLTLQRDGRLLIDSLSANSAVAALRASGDFLPPTPMGDAKVTLILADLAPFSPLAAVPLAGSASIDINYRSRAEGIQASWQGRLVDLVVPNVPPEALKPEIWLAGTASLQSDRTWRLQSARVATDAVVLTVEGRGRGPVGEVDLSLSLPRLAALGLTMDGAATVTGKIVRQEDGVLSARLESTGELAGKPITLAGSVVRDVDGGLSVPSFKGKWASAAIDISDFAIGPKGAVGAGRLHVAELRDLALVTGSNIAGTLDLELATDLQTAGDKLRGRLTGRNLRGIGEIDRVTATLTSDLKTADVTVQASGGRSSGSLIANVQPTEQGVRFFLTRFEARQGAIPVALIAPARAHLVGSRVTIEQPARLKVAGGTVTVGGTVDPVASDISVDVAALPLAAAKAFAPTLDLDGTLQAKLRLRGALAAPSIEGTYAANGVKLRRPETMFLPALALAGSGSLIGQQAAFDARLSGGAATALTLKGKATLPSARAPLAISAKITGATDLALFGPAIGASVRGLSGRLQPDLDITLNGDAIGGSGTLTLSAMSLNLPDSGLRLDRGEALIVLQDQSLQVQRLRFQTAAGGEITATGTARLDLPRGLPVDLQITAKRAQIANRPDLVATVSSALRFSGSMVDGFDVSGPVTVDRAEINIGLGQIANFPTVEVREVNKPGVADPLPPPRKAGAAPPPRPVGGPAVRLALTVEAPRAIFVRGRGLDAEVGGRLAIGGIASQPAVTGLLTLRRGDFNLAGRRLAFSRGNVSLIRLDSIEPIIDFLASTTAAQTTINVAITGTSRAPRIALTSTPALPQDELMATLLFGRVTSSLSPVEVLQVTQAIAELTGVTSGPGVIGQLRKRLGLDRLSVDSAGQDPSSVSLEAGRYVAPGVYIGAKQGAAAGSSRGVVEIEVLRNTKIEGDIGADSNGRIGVKVEWDY